MRATPSTPACPVTEAGPAGPGPATALVLAGGGAMAAYEAGALAYALDTLPRELGQAPRIDIYAGTSGGAFNVSFLAASADDLGGAARRLAEFWRHVRLDELVRFGVSERAIGCSVSTNRSTPSSTAGPR